MVSEDRCAVGVGRLLSGLRLSVGLGCVQLVPIVTGSKSFVSQKACYLVVW